MGSDPNGILKDKPDLQRIGAFGVSLGGIVVGEPCRIDSRLHGEKMENGKNSTLSLRRDFEGLSARMKGRFRPKPDGIVLPIVTGSDGFCRIVELSTNFFMLSMTPTYAGRTCPANA